MAKAKAKVVKRRLVYRNAQNKISTTNKYDVGVLIHIIQPCLQVAGLTFVGFAD